MVALLAKAVRPTKQTTRKQKNSHVHTTPWFYHSFWFYNGVLLWNCRKNWNQSKQFSAGDLESGNHVWNVRPVFESICSRQKLSGGNSDLNTIVPFFTKKKSTAGLGKMGNLNSTHVAVFSITIEKSETDHFRSCMTDKCLVFLRKNTDNRRNEPLNLNVKSYGL